MKVEITGFQRKNADMLAETICALVASKANSVGRFDVTERTECHLWWGKRVLKGRIINMNIPPAPTIETKEDKVSE